MAASTEAQDEPRLGDRAGLWALVLIDSALFILFTFSFFEPKTNETWDSVSRSGRQPPARQAREPRPGQLEWKTTLGAVSVALLWALCYPLITTAVPYAPPLTTATLRALLAGLSLVTLAFVLRRPQPWGVEWLAVVAIGGCSTALGFAGMFLAGGRISPGIATVLANTQPLLAAVAGYCVLGERLTGWQAAAMATAFVGITLIAAPAVLWDSLNTTGVSPAGVAFVLVGAVGVAAGNVIMKRFARRLDPIAATGWQLLAGGLLLLPVAGLWGRSGSIEWRFPFILALTGLAIPGTAIAFALWFAIIHRAPLNTLNIFSFLTPVLGLAIGAALYDERLTGVEIAGACLVLIGAWLAARRRPTLTRHGAST